MKLLMVTPYFYPKIGGLENYAYNIAVGLIKKYKWEVVVVTSNHKSKKDLKEKLNGLTIYRLGSWFKLSNTPINPMWYFTMKEIIKKEKPNIINAHSPVPFIADIAALISENIPFVLTYHAGSMKKGSILFDSFIKLYEKLFLSKLFKKADKVICSSQFVKKSLVNKFNSQSTVITPAVDTAIFKPSSTKRDKNSILFVGRYANVFALKGFNYLLEAVKDIPNIKLRVIGERIKIKQKNVSFLGIKTGKALAKEMQKSSLLTLPSIAPMESFGMVLIEAMACKTPVIGTHMGGIPEIINNKKNGLLIQAKNSSRLKGAILEIAQNPIQAKKMGTSGFNDVKKNYLWKNKIFETNKQLLTLIT